MKTKPCPKVSVVLPVFNGLPYLRPAVESILSQTFTNFELLLINDGSTDGSRESLLDLEDVRLHWIDCDRRGLIKTLNEGLSQAKGEYIGIMHSDDVALPKRLEKQVDFLDLHPQIGVLGSAYYLMEPEGRITGWVLPPLTDLEIRWASLFSSPFGHPTIMLRRAVLDEHHLRYCDQDGSVERSAVEDYELWSRLLVHTRSANLPDLLLKYRVHPESRTGQNRKSQLVQNDAIAWKMIRSELPNFSITAQEASQLRAWFVGGDDFFPESTVKRAQLVGVYLRMLDAYLKKWADCPSAASLRKEQYLKVFVMLLQVFNQPGIVPTALKLFGRAPWLPYWIVERMILRAFSLVTRPFLWPYVVGMLNPKKGRNP